jgi:cytochrome c oxidase accessory protein FixG
VGFAAFTGFTFVGFFSPIHALGPEIAAGRLGGWEFFWLGFYALATYGNAGFLREQVCKYMCPYARFQSAMFDRNTFIISYDAKRGEPRGSRPRGASARSLGQGDCVDCTLCVQACPTGIDIRKGLQYECVACAACIDACDAVMDKVGSPRGLVRYSTQAEIDGTPRRVLRPRVLIYASVLLSLVTGFAYAITHRAPVGLDVMRDRNALYRELDDGRIENVFSIRILNKDQRGHTFRLSTRRLDNAAIDSDTPAPAVGPEEVKTVVVRVRIPGGQEHGGRDFSVVAEALDETHLTVSTQARFFAAP